MAQSSFKTEFTLTKDQSLLSLNVTSGDKCFWPIQNTSLYPVVGTTHCIMIGGNPLDLIQLDFTKSTDPGVTAGSVRSDYINTIHDLVRMDDVVTITGIVGTTGGGGGGGGTIDGIVGVTAVTALDVVGDTAMNAVVAQNAPSLIVRTGHFGLDVARGLHTGVSFIHVQGFNPTLNSSDTEDIWWYGGDHNWLSSASVLRLDGDNSNDNSGSNGVRQITIEGLDASCNFITDTLSTNGTGQSSNTSNSYLRVNRVYATQCGTYHGSNYANIYVETTGNVIVSAMGGGHELSTGSASYGAGYATDGRYSVAAGKTAYIMSVYMCAQADREMGIMIWKNENIDDNSSPYSSRHCVFQSAEIKGFARHAFEVPIRVPEKSDIWMRAKNGDASTGDVSCHMVIVVCDN